MKRILITGAESYIGTSVAGYLLKWVDRYMINTIDVRNDNWRKIDFSIYDTIFHVAGIAHSDTGKVSNKKRALYRKVNTKLTIEIAKKAKAAGIKQFIFMSSAIVYGETPQIGKKRMITANTGVDPENWYGLSKLKAEEGIQRLNSESFKVVILRSPMIYGKNSKGNYQSLSKIADKTRFFPYIDNCRSMLYVENLSEFVRLMIENEERGIFFPQNKEFVNTSVLVKTIRDVKRKKTTLVKGFTWALKFLSLFTRKVNKAFGSWYYDQSMSEYKQEYRLVNFKESIRRTEL